MVCVNCLSQRQPFLEQSFSYYNFAFSEENHLLFCNEKHDFFPNLWLKINELLKDTFLLSSNKIIHFLVPHDWQICINSRPLVLQYKPLLLVFKEWLFIFRTCTRRLPSVNWHTDMGSVQSKCISKIGVQKLLHFMMDIPHKGLMVGDNFLLFNFTGF